MNDQTTNKQREVILIFGRTGSGKSELVKKNFIPILSRLVIIDFMCEYSPAGSIIFTSLQDFINYLKTHKDEFFCYVIRFTDDQELENLFDILFYLEDYFLIVEEAELYISPHGKSQNFYKIIRYGRHNKISVIAVARRVTELSNDVKAQATSIYTYKQILERDIKVLIDLGFDRTIENLPDFQYKKITL